MIEVNNVTKYYGIKKAVDNISFKVDNGEIIGFLGPNGAGKTTTMRMLTGYLYPNEGQIKINGFDILDNPIEAKKQIGYLPEIAPLYTDMKVRDYLDFVADIKHVTTNKKNHINDIINKVGLSTVENTIISKLSKGFKQRVGLGEALIGDPNILILDEPTIGLDPNQIIEIRNLIKEFGESRTIILSSHILQEVSAICSRIIVINDGKLVAVDTKETLMENFDTGQRLKVIAEGDFDTIKRNIMEINGIKHVELLNAEVQPLELVVSVEKGLDLRKEISRKIINAGFNLLEQSKITMSLEDIFIRLTTGDEG